MKVDAIEELLEKEAFLKKSNPITETMEKMVALIKEETENWSAQEVVDLYVFCNSVFSATLERLKKKAAGREQGEE